MTLSRRNFLKSSTATAVGLSVLGSAAPCFKAAAAEANTGISVAARDRALVFIMLDGGNDSFNMLIPSSGSDYQTYRQTRGNLALAQNDLLPLDGYHDSHGRSFALHPSMQAVQTLFNHNKLAFVANTAPLVEPTDKARYQSGAANLPLGLFSHADQFKHWQTAQPNKRLNLGWFGRIADTLQANKRDEQIAMNISLAGNNIVQNGNLNSAYTITESGSVGLVIEKPTGNFPRSEEAAFQQMIYNSFVNSLNANQGTDPFKSTYLQTLKNAQLQHESFQAATTMEINATFSDTDLSKQLRKVVQTIRAASVLGHRQQTFFIRYRGWDHHDELTKNQQTMLAVLSNALGEFQTALEQANIADKVLTFTGSDFGRTLTSNGNGSDHGWGGNMMVMGTAVNGGQIYGDYPSLALGDSNALDIGNGVLIPTTAIDSVYAEIAKWFGVDNGSLTTLFPNLGNFSQTDLSQLLRV